MTKYVNDNGVSEMWTNIKNWVTSQLLGYSQTGHTHSADDVSNVVTTNTTQNISSQKTITNNYHFDRRTNTFTMGVLPTSDSTLNPTWFLDNNGSYFAWHQLHAKTDGSLRQVFQLRNRFLNGAVSNAEGSSFLSTGLEYGFNSNGKQYFAFGGSLNCNLIPLDNQTKNIGSSSYKWNNLYVKNGYVTNLYINGTQFLLSDYAQVNHTHSISDITDFPTLATVATSGSYEDLSNKPTIPTVNNATLTIQKNGTNVATFTSNSNTDVTCNITVPTKISDLTSDSGLLTSVLPIGSYIQFAGSQAPDGFLVCNGGEISRTTYSALFDVIGTTYGSGDGSTTFNLPNLTDRFLQGSTTSGTVINAGLPNITGNFGGTVCLGSQRAGAFNKYGNERGISGTASAGSGFTSRYDFDASRSNSIYGNSTTVQPPALTCLICIKY